MSADAQHGGHERIDVETVDNLIQFWGSKTRRNTYHANELRVFPRRFTYLYVEISSPSQENDRQGLLFR